MTGIGSRAQIPFSVADESTRQSSERVMESLHHGRIKEQILTNDAISFSEKEVNYKIGFSRLLKSRNFAYILDVEAKRP